MKSKEKDFPQIVYQLHVENKKKNPHSAETQASCI